MTARLATPALVLVLLLVASGTAHATDYHVDATGGSDTNPGTSAQPWRTLSRVNKHAFAPGDRILFKRGEAWAESLTPPSSGTAGKPIVFEAYGSGNRPKITGAPGDSCIQWTQARSHLVFRDLHLHRCGQPGGSKEGGINVWSDPATSTDITVEGCLIEESRTWNIYVSGLSKLVIRENTIRDASLEHGIYVDGTLGMDDVLVEKNDISGNNAMCIQYNSNGHNHITGAVLRYNRLHDCGYGAVNNIGAQKLLAHHNLIYGAMPGIYNACDAAALTKCATGGVYHHNTIVLGGKWTACISDGQTADHAEFRSNICVHQGSSGALIEAKKGTSDYNLFFGMQTFVRGGTTYSSLASYQAKSGQDGHSTFADPLFLDPAGHDYHLSGSSPAVDLAPSLGYLVDLDGKPTPVGAGADVGAFEHQGTGPLKDAAASSDVAVDGAVPPDAGPGLVDRAPAADSTTDTPNKDAGAFDATSTGPDADATATVEGGLAGRSGGSNGGCALGRREPRRLPAVFLFLVLALLTLLHRTRG
jgi:hypothetical protein